MSGTATARHKRISEGDGQEAVVYEAHPTPTPEDIKAQLKKHTHLKKDERATIISRFITLRASILANIPPGNEMVVKAWTDAIPTDMPAVNRMLVAEQTDTLYQLHQALVFHRATCRPTKSLDAAFDPLDSTMKTATWMAGQQKAETQMGTQIKLTTQQLGRKFLEYATIPSIEAHRICLFCGHDCVDEPNHNKLVLEENLKREAEYEEKENAYHLALSVGSNPKTTRKPTRPTPKFQIYQCHCGEIGCIDSNGKGCPIKCTDSKTGKHYGQDPVTGHCLCPICSCSCKVGYRTDAHQHFEVNRRLSNPTPKPGISGNGAPPSNSASVQESNAALQKILDSSFSNAFRSVLHEKSQGYEGNADLAVTNALECAAIALSKEFHGDSVHTPFLEQQRALIGCPTTVVTLQSGNQFDTRSLNPSRKTQRAKNNSLEDASDLERKKPALPRGSRLRPDNSHDVTLSVAGASPPSPVCSPEAHQPKARRYDLMTDRASLIPFISPEARANSVRSDYFDVDSYSMAPVVASANSPATELINRVANRSFDTSGITRILHDVDTNIEAAIPVDPNALHRYNDIIANPEIAYDVIRRSVESHARLETDTELNSQDAVRMYDFVRKSKYPNP